MARTITAAKKKRVLDTRPDTLDFRDRMYEPALIEVPTRVDLDDYREHDVPILDQGEEGACTGFGLATVANYLLRRRKVIPDRTPVSPWMFYSMAKRYDEWRGERYEGSSPRGAMKGWHKHGVCRSDLWDPEADRLTDERMQEAARRPLGAYYRINHRDLVSLHAALSEVGILYASALVHEGWDDPKDGRIERKEKMLGGHAFAIVAYDEEGFWIQNSWGDDWGAGGFGHVTYDDWLENATDTWVARLGVPATLRRAESVAVAHSASASQLDSYSYPDLRPHIVSLGNDGSLRAEGSVGTSEEDVQSIFEEDFPRITDGWKKKRILLYAHGGLVPESTAVQRLADYRRPLLDAEIYPLSFIWRTDFWSTLQNILRDALDRRRPEGFLDATKDFMLDRLDDALEPVARLMMGKSQWDEMKENAAMATTSSEGGARLVARHLAQLLKDDDSIELHVVGHSAGAVFHARFVQLLSTDGQVGEGPLDGEQGFGLPISTCTLWAPACTVELFKATYLPAVRSGAIGRLGVYALTDRAERDDQCASIYHKSLLYLVSHAFEKQPRIPLFREGVPLLGMERFVARGSDTADKDLVALFQDGKAELILAPNTAALGASEGSTARQHGDFDDDRPTVLGTVARILGKDRFAAPVTFPRSASSLKERRRALVS